MRTARFGGWVYGVSVPNIPPPGGGVSPRINLVGEQIRYINVVAGSMEDTVG